MLRCVAARVCVSTGFLRVPNKPLDTSFFAGCLQGTSVGHPSRDHTLKIKHSGRCFYLSALFTGAAFPVSN